MRKEAKGTGTALTFALFGATGDLAAQKIFPALEGLFLEGALGAEPRIVAIGRRDWDDAAFATFLRESSKVSSGAFLSRVSYAFVDIEAGKGFKELAAAIGPGDAVFYSSLAPALHGPAIKGLRDAGLLRRGSGGGRVMVEKPFGTDYQSACELDRFLASFLDEGQIYRVDHYLGKETVRAVMDVHEGTAHWGRLMTSESVKEIKVRMYEERGVEGRGASYDGVGAFRDVGQNHMLEMLAAIAADYTGDWQSDRALALRHLEPPAKTCELSRRGQYQGYHAEKGVRPGSTTETAFEVVATFASGKLKGVPLVLEAGKKMGASEAFIEVFFQDISGLPQGMRFSVQPEQEVALTARDGSVERYAIPRRRDAYGNVILAALRGERRSFVGRQEIEALWSYADHVVACWGKVPLEIYGKDRPFLLD
ncbi:MAG TPA: hypothetical protein VFQ72_03480 [Candidatus Paceibacterota bacterium]|nr:hypothetical protein [Candidatus Paceibacterota bacterium]